MSNILNAALAYQKMGLSIIPVGINKKPLIKWEEYQRRRATPDEIRAWFSRFPTAQVAIVCEIGRAHV